MNELFQTTHKHVQVERSKFIDRLARYTRLYIRDFPTNVEGSVQSTMNSKPLGVYQWLRVRVVDEGSWIALYTIS